MTFVENTEGFASMAIIVTKGLPSILDQDAVALGPVNKPSTPW
jgi:hypothetical protein